MKEVNISEYPKNSPWENKTFSMPNIPRGNVGVLETLKIILEKVKNNENELTILNIPGSDSNITLKEACIRLRPMQLVKKDANGWHLSKESKVWLDTKDNLYLAAFLSSKIKFVAEILYYLDTPKTSNELNDIAVNEYSLNWKTKSDINSRLVWLRQLGLVDFEYFSLLYNITESGKKFLNYVKIDEPINVDYSIDDTLNDESLEIPNWILDYSKNNNINRKSYIGYILGNTNNLKEVISEYINLLYNDEHYDNILKYTMKNYEISESSTKTWLKTLNNMGILERKTDTIYGITKEAQKWFENPNLLDLICILHSHFGFMFEILDVLKDKEMNYKELATIAKVSYSFERENVDEIRKRIHLLKKAKLIKNSKIDKYTTTNRGKKILELFQIETPKRIREFLIETEKKEITEFFTELRLAAKDSSNFERFEKVVKTAFEKLGFEATWLGSSGKTDVLIKASGSANYSVAIDTKSTISGNVTDSLVDFDTIIEHRNKHQTNYSVIIGYNFLNERLIKRAIEHNVVLIDVDTLEKMIKNHIEIPLPVRLYEKIFSKPGIVNISYLDKERDKIKRNGYLIHEVIKCLIEEKDDKITKGLLKERDIYLTLRNKEIFKENTPSLEELNDILKFLSSPLIGCIEETKDGYLSTSSLKEAASKFEFFSRMCQK